VFVKKGYARATIEEITAAAGVSRATLYLHFDSKSALLAAATEKMRAEAIEGARQLADVLIAAERAGLRQWVDWALNYYARNRPMALAGEEPSSARTSRREVRRTALEYLEPWVETWPLELRVEARMRFELAACRCTPTCGPVAHAVRQSGAPGGPVHRGLVGHPHRSAAGARVSPLLRRD